MRPYVLPSTFFVCWNHISVPIGQIDSFFVQMSSTIDSRYPISFVKIDPLTLELLPFFGIGIYRAKPILLSYFFDPEVQR